MVEHPTFDHQVSEADPATETSQVIHLDIVPSEEVEQLVGLGVVDVEDLLAEDRGIVGAVGDGPGVEVTIESAVAHRYVVSIYKFYSRMFSNSEGIIV